MGLPVGMRRQEEVLHAHIQLCASCGKRLREPILFAKGSSRYIRAFGQFTIRLCGITTMKTVASFLGGWAGSS